MSEISAAPGPAIAESVVEVQAIFPSDAALQDAIARLTQAGFDRADLSLPHVAPSPSRATPEQGAANPDTETDARQERTLHTSMAGSVGALAAAGVTVATGGAALAAVAAAAAAGLGVGALVNAATTAGDRANSEARDRAAASGTLVLSARVTSAERARRARAAMAEAGETRIADVQRQTADVTSGAGVNSAAWTG
jgi:hypothetical protein